MSDKIKQMGKGIALAEEQRDKRKINTFLADIFRGKPSFEKIKFVDQSDDEKEKEGKLLSEIREFLLKETDPEEMIQKKEIPRELLERMAELGLFALKVPKELGGKGLSQSSFNKVIGLVTSYSGPIPLVISADSSIGCKYPLLNFGTPEQIERFLPELMKQPSGFCFTEQDAGSDATGMRTQAVKVFEDGKVVGYRITGQKWYTTNPQLAQYLAVVAKITDYFGQIDRPDYKECFGVFIVPTSLEGVNIGPGNEFEGMESIYNANPEFTKVFVPKFNLVGEKRPDLEEENGWHEREGSGFRIAMQSLNTGRVAIAASCTAVAKQALTMSAWWANKREQFGRSIGRFEAIGSGMLAPGAADIFAMEAMTKFAGLLVDQKEDTRIDAAATKVFASERMWQIINNMMQIFGGRGYEKYSSWIKREKFALPVGRIWKDARPNTIFEGATQLITYVGSRDGLNDYLEAGEVFLKNKWSFEDYESATKAVAQFSGQYAKSFAPTFCDQELPRELEGHMEYVETKIRKLSRKIIEVSGLYKGKLTVKQLTLSRIFMIALLLDAMAIVCRYAKFMEPEYGQEGIELADIFCRKTIRELEGDGLFHQIHHNDDNFARYIAGKLLAGEYDHILKKGIIPLVDLVKE